MKRIIELSENDYKALKEDGVQNHIALADTIIARSMPYEPQKEIVPVCKVTFDKEQLQEIVDKKVAKLVADNAKPEVEWIPVSERLPKEDNDYLITYVSYGARVVSKSWFNTRSGFIYDNVIAWQPLPESYKDGDEE